MGTRGEDTLHLTMASAAPTIAASKSAYNSMDPRNHQCNVILLFASAAELLDCPNH